MSARVTSHSQTHSKTDLQQKDVRSEMLVLLLLNTQNMLRDLQLHAWIADFLKNAPFRQPVSLGEERSGEVREQEADRASVAAATFRFLGWVVGAWRTQKYSLDLPVCLRCFLLLEVLAQ